jgi:putative transposase
MMHLVEQHGIDRRDRRFAAIDQAAFASKNLYNAALSEVRQAYLFEHQYLDYYAVYERMKRHEAYRALPTKVAEPSASPAR